MVDNVVQFVKFFLEFDQFALHQRSKDGQTSLVVAGFIQNPIDLCLVGPQAWMMFQKPLALVESHLQRLIGRCGPLRYGLIVCVYIVLHTISELLSSINSRYRINWKCGDIDCFHSHWQAIRLPSEQASRRPKIV